MEHSYTRSARFNRRQRTYVAADAIIVKSSACDFSHADFLETYIRDYPIRFHQTNFWKRYISIIPIIHNFYHPSSFVHSISPITTSGTISSKTCGTVRGTFQPFAPTVAPKPSSAVPSDEPRTVTSINGFSQPQPLRPQNPIQVNYLLA